MVISTDRHEIPVLHQKHIETNLSNELLVYVFRYESVQKENNIEFVVCMSIFVIKFPCLIHVSALFPASIIYSRCFKCSNL
jgi:hypothetical protein